MSEEIFWWRPIPRFRYWVEDEDEEQLQAISDQDLSLVFEHNMVVWYTPGRGVVFQSLIVFRAGYVLKIVVELTVFSREQRTDRTTCLSGQVAI